MLIILFIGVIILIELAVRCLSLRVPPTTSAITSAGFTVKPTDHTVDGHDDEAFVVVLFSPERCVAKALIIANVKREPNNGFLNKLIILLC